MTLRGDALMAPHGPVERGCQEAVTAPHGPVERGGQEGDATWALMCTKAVMAGACPGHPRLFGAGVKTGMAGSSPAMTGAAGLLGMSLLRSCAGARMMLQDGSGMMGAAGLLGMSDRIRRMRPAGEVQSMLCRD